MGSGGQRWAAAALSSGAEVPRARASSAVRDRHLQVGATVLIVNGRCRGETAELLSINQDAFCVTVKVDGGEQRGRVLEKVEYEDICKLA